MAHSPSLPFAVMLLAGGYSRRMGQDKAWIEWQGGPLWQHQIETLIRLPAQRRLISCREEQKLQDTPHFAGWEWLFDPAGYKQGPMGAVARSLRLVNLPMVVLAVDMPFMTAEFLQRELIAGSTAGRGRFFRTEQGIEPMAALYVPEMLPVMDRRLARGERGLQRMIEEAMTLNLAELRTLKEEERPVFANLNTPGEWVQSRDSRRLG
jgi:molybdenum cofactor guanylyltransferase